MLGEATAAEEPGGGGGRVGVSICAQPTHFLDRLPEYNRNSICQQEGRKRLHLMNKTYMTDSQRAFRTPSSEEETNKRIPSPIPERGRQIYRSETSKCRILLIYEEK